jgi:hypothetical protein
MPMEKAKITNQTTPNTKQTNTKKDKPTPNNTTNK